MSTGDTSAINTTDEAKVDVEDRPGSILLRRIIPISAVLLLVSFMGLIVYGVLFPADGVANPSGVAINESGALVNLEPRPIADFTLLLFDGGEVRLSDLRGQIVVVNFWASWCPPCREEARDLERAWQELRDENVVFLGLNVWDDQEDALAFIAEFDVTYLNGVTEDSGAAVTVDFGIRGIPETFILNEEGLVVAKFIGPVKSDELIQTVREVKNQSGSGQ